MTLTCNQCSAPLPPRHPTDEAVTCHYCGTVRALPRARRPDVISALDFSSSTVPGWRTTKHATYDFGGSPPRMTARLDGDLSRSLYTILKTEGTYDEVDAAVTIRFVEGKGGTKESFHIKAGFSLRLQAGTSHCYVCTITDDGWIGVGAIDAGDGKDKWVNLVKRTRFSGLKTGWGDPNRLRFVARGDRLQVFANDQLAASLRDDRFGAGRVELLVNPAGETACVAFSDLVLKQPTGD